MRSLLIALLISALATLTGCGMLTSWKAIPPPGGCDQCHAVPINADWRVTYQVARLTDERGDAYFQTKEGSFPSSVTPASSLSLSKTEDQACFDCHKAPSGSHKARRGRYHH